MFWTGELYGFYTEKPIDKVFTLIKEYAKSIAYEYEYNTQLAEEYLFFFKDKKMYDYHLKHGYNTNINGMGCFGVEAKRTKIDGIATLFQFDGRPIKYPLDINLVINDIYYYVLVVPKLIEKSPFSKQIHDAFHDILLNEHNL